MKAYQLALIQAGIVSDDQRRNGAFSAAEPIIEGRFAVRCFPDETAPELEDFSCTETLLRFGPHFDHTGTPTLTAQQRLNKSCFVVGYLDFRTNVKRTFLDIRMYCTESMEGCPRRRALSKNPAESKIRVHYAR